MSPKIYNIKEPLDLNRLRLAKPISKNGSHFIKTLDGDNPIYFLGPKCLSKNGFVKSGKKVFCDFVFSNEDSDFLAWLENLEESSKTCIFNNRETWFETPLDEHDIESSMASPFKPYKSGKYFIVRANVPTVLDKINIKVYDENEHETDPENIKENTNVLAVFEFQGIRCNVRSFQFEIELKQILIVEPEKLFEKCIIGKSTSTSPLNDSKSESNVSNIHVSNTSVSNMQDQDLSIPALTTKGSREGNLGNSVESGESDLGMTNCNDIGTLESDLGMANCNDVGTFKPDLDIITISDNNLAVPIELMDDDFPLEDATESHTDKEPPLKLKSRNDVYYKLYKEMRQRAKEAKREALANYLEAKRIKNTYFLEVGDESESENDLEDMKI